MVMVNFLACSARELNSAVECSTPVSNSMLFSVEMCGRKGNKEGGEVGSLGCSLKRMFWVCLIGSLTVASQDL